MDIIKEINKYIKLSEDKAKLEETNLIKKMQQYFIEEQEVCIEDPLIMHYFLMYLRKEKKPIETDTWACIIDGTSIHEGFIQFLKDKKLWNDYTAQLLCIIDKDDVDWSKKEEVFDDEWLEEDLFQNKDVTNDFAQKMMQEKSNKICRIIYEWDHLKDTKEWKETDISNIKSREGLSGIKLMKYLDSTLTDEFVINRMKKCLGSKKLFYDFEIYLDENNKPRVKTGESILQLKAKQYLGTTRDYLFKEDENTTFEPMVSKEQLAAAPKINYKFLTPTDLKVVVISKEYNIKKLVITTKEDYTVHLLYDELPHQLLRDCYKFALIGLINDIEKTLKKKVLDNFKVYVEFEHETNNIEKTPFLIKNENTVTPEKLYATHEYNRYLNRHAKYDLLPGVKEIVFNIDDVQFTKSNRCTHLTTNLTIQEYQKLKKVADRPLLPMFGDLQIDDDSFTVDANDLLTALAYNAICEADGTNNVFDLIKKNNDIQLIFLNSNSVDPRLANLKIVNYAYVPKKK